MTVGINGEDGGNVGDQVPSKQNPAHASVEEHTTTAWMSPLPPQRTDPGRPSSNRAPGPSQAPVQLRADWAMPHVEAPVVDTTPLREVQRPAQPVKRPIEPILASIAVGTFIGAAVFIWNTL